MKHFLLIIYFILPVILYAGDGFKFKAKLDSVPGKGFYRILLPPTVIANSRIDLADIRLFNSKHEEIAYVIKKENSHIENHYLTELQILENYPLYTAKTSRYIVRNPDKRLLNRLIFIIRNTSLQPEIIIKGSDNNKDWYFVTRGYLHSLQGEENDTTEYRYIEFPGINYPYIEIFVLHKKSGAIQILHVGYMDMKIVNGLYTDLPEPAIKQRDSLKMSYITMIFSEPFTIDKFIFKIEGPDYYYRNFRIGKYIRQNKKLKYFDELCDFSFASTTSNSFNVHLQHTDTLFLEIENDDNLPLKIKSLSAFQLNTYLIAQLDGKDNYFFYFGNTKLSTPKYDLKYFTENINLLNLPVVKTIKIETISNSSIPSNPNFIGKNILWISIILIIIILGGVSVKLVLEINKKPK